MAALAAAAGCELEETILRDRAEKIIAIYNDQSLIRNTHVFTLAII